MPIWEEDAETTETKPALGLMDRVRAGNALPVLSNAAMLDLVCFGHSAFTHYYAQRVGYPFGLPAGISKIANFDRHTNRNSDIDCKTYYLECVKNYIYRTARDQGIDRDLLEEAAEQVDRLSVSAFARLLGYPRFDQGCADPLLVLADLPFKAYLTTSPFTFLEEALRRAGKEPYVKVCRWRGPVVAPEKEVWQIESSYTPSHQRPLVYHLCGLDAYPETQKPWPECLALTEDDYLELLVNLAQDRGNHHVDRLPDLVRGALFEDVILLGYSLESWAFRALYYGLVRPTTQQKDRRGLCCVQLSPDERKQQEKYLENYLDRNAHFDIFWGDLHEYTRTLSVDR
jgi:hypothetical protein